LVLEMIRLALVLLEVAAVAALLALGNIVFWRFGPRKPLWRRFLKLLAAHSPKHTNHQPPTTTRRIPSPAMASDAMTRKQVD